MKIHNEGLQGSTPVETGRTQGAPPTAGTGPLAGQKISGSEGDSVEISGISTQLAHANAIDGQQRANRVAELAALYARGQYRTSSTRLSQALVSSAIASPSGGDK
jgi:anti-sigma28 factor (negative regulator of flagellin synthesis)